MLPDRALAKLEVSTHKTLGEGFGAGQDAVHADAEHAYALYQDGAAPRRVARFAFSRITRDPSEATSAASLGLVLS